MNSDCPAVERLPDETALEEILLYELTQTSGALWSHYDNEYGKVIREINGDQTARKILLWATQEPPRRIIFPQDVAEALGQEQQQACEILALLYKADVIDRVGSVSYWGPADPMLRRYIQLVCLGALSPTEDGAG